DARLQAERARDAEAHLVRIDGVERAVVQRGAEVGERIAGDDASLGGLTDALLDRRPEVARHGAADDARRELDAAARRERLHLDPRVAEHAVAPGLLLVAALRRRLLPDRLLVRHA